MITDDKQTRRTILGIDAALSNGAADCRGVHIAGIVVHTRPENVERVRHSLERLSGTEVHAADPRGKLVVTLEAASDGMIADMLNLIPELPGVIACTLAHHHSESGEEQSA